MWLHKQQNLRYLRQALKLNPKKGGTMKRKTVLITLFSLFIGIGSLLAQRGISFQVSYKSGYTPGKYADKDIREFREFQKDVDRFSRAVQREQVSKARKIKSEIVYQMRSEIRDTRQKIRLVKRDLEGYSNHGLRKKGSRKRYNYNKYSKRGSYSYYTYKDLKRLNQRLEKQTKILFKLENLYLDRSYRFYKQARKHESLMYDFEKTLKADISYSLKDYRNRNRYRRDG